MKWEEATVPDKNSRRFAEINERRRRVRELVDTHCLQTGDSLSAISRSVNMSRTWLQSWLSSEKPTDLKFHLAEALALRIGVSLDYLLHGDEAKQVKGYVPNANTAPMNRLPSAIARDVPVLGAATCSKDGAMIIESDNPIEYLGRPIGAQSVNQLYAIYVHGDSMQPRFLEGELVFVAPRPARRGDYVVVQATDSKGMRVAYLKQFNGRTDDGSVELEQLYPPTTIRIPADRVLSVHLVLSNNDLYRG